MQGKRLREIGKLAQCRTEEIRIRILVFLTPELPQQATMSSGSRNFDSEVLYFIAVQLHLLSHCFGGVGGSEGVRTSGLGMSCEDVM